MHTTTGTNFLSHLCVCVCESSVLLPIVGIKAMLLHWAPFLSTMYHAQECKWSRRPGHTNTYNDVVEDIFVICYNSHFGMRVHIPLSEQIPLKKLFLTFKHALALTKDHQDISTSLSHLLI